MHLKVGFNTYYKSSLRCTLYIWYFSSSGLLPYVIQSLILVRRKQNVGAVIYLGTEEEKRGNTKFSYTLGIPHEAFVNHWALAKMKRESGMKQNLNMHGYFQIFTY